MNTKSLRGTLLKRIDQLSVGIKEADKQNGEKSQNRKNSVQSLQKSVSVQKSTAPSISKEKNTKYLLDILKSSFPLVQLDNVRPVIMALIKALGLNTPKEYLQKLAEKSLYKTCSIEIKQLIWQTDPTLFHSELEPLIKTVLRLRNDLLGEFSENLTHKDNFLMKNHNTISRTSRPGAEIVEKIAKMCSTGKVLYQSCIEYLRTRFNETKCLHYCTLRSEIIMYLHDMDSAQTRDSATAKTQRTVRKTESVLNEVDQKPHKVAWCVEALIRNVNTSNPNPEVELRRIKELEQAIEKVTEPVLMRVEKSSDLEVMYDCFMILADPFFVNNCLLWGLVKRLHSAVQKNGPQIVQNSKKDAKKTNSSVYEEPGVNDQLLRSVDSPNSQHQNVILTFVNILHMSMMAFEQETMFFNRKSRKNFQNTMLTQVLPLLQSMTVELQMKKVASEIKNQYPDKFKNPEKSAEKNLENELEFKKFLESQNMPILPEIDESVFENENLNGALNKIKNAITPKILPINPHERDSCVLRGSVIIIRHYMIYCMKFAHFECLKAVGKMLVSLHDVTFGPTIANVTVGDAFFLQYLSSYLIFKGFRGKFKNNAEIVPQLVKMMSYTAPDPLPAGTSSKQRKAANKAGFYDRLCQAEIVLGLVSTLPGDLIPEQVAKKRIWKKLAPPSITTTLIPSGIDPGVVDNRWMKRWEAWEEVCKKGGEGGEEGLKEFDREKLKKKERVVSKVDKVKIEKNGKPEKIEKAKLPKISIKMAKKEELTHTEKIDDKNEDLEDNKQLKITVPKTRIKIKEIKKSIFEENSQESVRLGKRRGKKASESKSGQSRDSSPEKKKKKKITDLKTRSKGDAKDAPKLALKNNSKTVPKVGSKANSKANTEPDFTEPDSVETDSIHNLSIHDETSQDSVALPELTKPAIFDSESEPEQPTELASQESKTNESEPEIELPQRRGNRRRHNKRLFSSENDDTTQESQDSQDSQDFQEKPKIITTRIKKVKTRLVTSDDDDVVVKSGNGRGAKKVSKLKIKLRKPR